MEESVLKSQYQGGVSDPDTGEYTPNADCTTDANGQVSWTYTSSLLGVDTITASVEGTVSNKARNEWILIRNIPTLSQWGMISAAVILGHIGLFYLIARKRRALS